MIRENSTFRLLVFKGGLPPQIVVLLIKAILEIKREMESMSEKIHEIRGHL